MTLKSKRHISVKAFQSVHLAFLSQVIYVTLWLSQPNDSHSVECRLFGCGSERVISLDHVFVSAVHARYCCGAVFNAITAKTTSTPHNCKRLKALWTQQALMRLYASCWLEFVFVFLDIRGSLALNYTDEKHNM